MERAVAVANAPTAQGAQRATAVKIQIIPPSRNKGV